ncbi:MAG: ShlB/FhaC/HecB family hemolysin secretion/activation protein, partial [Candidatus Omnitrophota bacterium]
GQTTFSPRITFGTERFLGASDRGHPSASRAGTGGFFVKYEQSLRRVQRMPFESYMTIRSQFQLASRTLPSLEQMQFGGMYSVRGYPEGEYMADAGASLNMDWFFPAYIIPKTWKLPYSDTPLRNQIEPVIFMDMGGGVLMKNLPGERKNMFLMGIGGGLKVQIGRNLYLRLDWAQRIGDRPTPGSGPSTFHMMFQFEA